MAIITVIVPVYNVEPYLYRCINSILGQTITDFDLVLIDDGSPDHCGEICDEYSNTDNRIHVIHHAKNQGLSAARNTGIEWALTHSDSTWITFIDSDDWVSSKYLEGLLIAIEGYSISAVCRKATHGESYPDPSELSFTIQPTEDFFCRQGGNGIVVWGKLYKKDLFCNIRFPVGKLHEDAFVSHEILFQFKEIPVITQTLYFFRINPCSITRQKWSIPRLDELKAIEKQLSFFTRHGYLNAANSRYRYYIKISLSSLQKVYACSDLSEKEKKWHTAKIKKGQRRMILKYHSYKWASVWNRGDDLWFYSPAFTI